MIYVLPFALRFASSWLLNVWQALTILSSVKPKQKQDMIVDRVEIYFDQKKLPV